MHYLNRAGILIAGMVVATVSSVNAATIQGTGKSLSELDTEISRQEKINKLKELRNAGRMMELPMMNAMPAPTSSDEESQAYIPDMQAMSVASIGLNKRNKLFAVIKLADKSLMHVTRGSRIDSATFVSKITSDYVEVKHKRDGRKRLAFSAPTVESTTDAASSDATSVAPSPML